MKFVVAPDSFKGSLTASQVGSVIRKAICAESPDSIVEVIPMADGGEGSQEALVFATGGQKFQVKATGPLGEVTFPSYGVLGNSRTVVIEVAKISGLPMVPNENRDPTKTTTYGIGEVILGALEAGYRDFIVCLGGSATNDGGLGMLQALGVKATDSVGNEVSPNGAGLSNIANVSFDHIDKRVWESSFLIASDVDNPLCGRRGASHVFGPQKGASEQQVKWLDAGLRDFASFVESTLGRNIQDIPGAGAAGGLGFAFLALGGRIESGAQIIASAVQLEKILDDADWVITGEGCSDSQTLHGKVPFYVANCAKKHGVSTILLSGSIADDTEELYKYFTSLHSILKLPITLSDAMLNAESLLSQATRNVIRLILAARVLHTNLEVCTTNKTILV